MLTPNPCLKEFMQSAPVCQQTADLNTVLEIFSQGECANLVVVSEQLHPLGVVSWRRLMLHLIGKMGSDAARTETLNHSTIYSTKQKKRVSVKSYSLPYPTTTNDKGFLLHSFIEPLATVAAGLTLSQFLPKLQNQLAADWALVDEKGKFLGLLDSGLLLKYLARANATTASRSQPSPIQTLIQLLEQLPLPLMLQTGAGEVLTQNITWRQLVGEFQNLDGVKPTAAVAPTTTYQQYKYPRYSSLDIEPSTDEYGSLADNTLMSSLPTNIKTEDVATNWEMLAEIASNTTRDHAYNPERIWKLVQIPLEQLQEYPEKSEIWLVLATDVTEQQLLAKEVAAKNADLVRLNRLKDEFLACISHELKTPLTSVIGLSSLLKDKLLGELNERQLRYAKLIHHSGRQLMTIVNDILDLTRMETGQVELTLEPLNIRDVCDRSILQAQQNQSEKDLSQEESPTTIPFTLEIEPDLEMLVADEMRLRQMLFHLLDNGLKFTNKDGAIGLNVSRWEGWVAFTVWDTGIGIPHDKQHLIFQKFQQLENPLTRTFQGTGLGLVLTQHLARLHGGEVSFISKLGQGSQFTLLLPPLPPQLAAFIDPKSPNCSTKPNRLVLIVETVPNYIEEFTKHLTSFGYRVVIARSGTEAIEKVRRLQPCAIIVNPHLPQLSGWDVLTILKSDAQTRHIPVLMTGLITENPTVKSYQADGFLSLPVEPSALRQSLANLILPQSKYHKPPVVLTLTPTHENMGKDNSTVVESLRSAKSMNYRILEADDLGQAALLARVWHPDVMLLDSRDLDEPLTYLLSLTKYTSLASLPLITLDRQTTEAANQVAELSVFPCLTPVDSNNTDALLQVIQVAVGMCCQPTILVVDIAKLPDLSAETSKIDRLSHLTATPGASMINHSHEWLQALMQYLHTAGFKSLLSHSWAELYRQIQDKNVDLVLIHLEDMPHHPLPLVQALNSFAERPTKTPILLLDRRTGEPAIRPYASDLEPVLNTVCTHRIGIDNQSMAELLELINQTMGASSYSRSQESGGPRLGVKPLL